MSRIYPFSFNCDIIQGFYIIFRNLLEGLFTDQIYGFNIMLFYYCLVCYCIVYICITFVRQESEQNRYFLLDQHCPTLFANFDNQVVLCSMLRHCLFCNSFVHFAQYRYTISLIALYVIIMSCTSLRVNRHYIVCLNVKELLARSRRHI